jgi:hypothetical protein
MQPKPPNLKSITSNGTLRLVAHLARVREAGGRELRELIGRSPRAQDRDNVWNGLIGKLQRDAIVLALRSEHGATRYQLTNLGLSLAPHAVALTQWLDENEGAIVAARAHTHASGVLENFRIR